MKKLLIFLMLALFLVSLVSASVEYTPISKTVCERGICSSTIHSSTTYVEEDNQWKHYTEARSLKEKGFEEQYIEIDPDYPVEVLDFNSTHVKMNVGKFTIFNEHVPLRRWRINQTKWNEFVADCDLKKAEHPQQKYTGQCNTILNDVDNIPYGLMKKYFKDFYTQYEDETITINILDFGSETVIREAEIGEIIEFGPNSTTITINAQGSEYFYADNLVMETNPSTVYDSDQTISIGGENGPVYEQRGYFGINISDFVGVNVISSSFNLYVNSLNGNSGNCGFDHAVGDYCNVSYYNTSALTWNNRNTLIPGCTTNHDFYDFGIFDLQCSSRMSTGWHSSNITEYIVNETLDDGLFVVLAWYDDSNNYNTYTVSTTDNSNPSLRPYLVINYTYPWNLTLNSPEEDIGFINSEDIVFNCSSEIGTTENISLTNLSLIIDGVSNETVTNSTPQQSSISLQTTIPASSYSQGTHNWTCLSVDTNGNSYSPATINFYINPIGFKNESYTLETYETKVETFIINTTFDNVTWDSVTATLNYDGTVYTSTASVSGEDADFIRILDVPLLSGGEENRTFYWNFTLTNSTNTDYVQSIPHNQTVVPSIITECNATYNQTGINITVKEEATYNLLNADFDIAGSYSGGTLYSKSFSFSEGSPDPYVELCISPSYADFEMDALLSYSASGYDPREYYFNDYEINNITDNFDVYLLATNASDIFTFTVVDQSLNNIEGAFIYVERWDIGTDTFYNVAVLETSSDGTASTNLRLTDAWYRYKVYYNGILELTTEPVKEVTTSRTLTITLSEDDPYETFEDISSNLTFSEVTNVTTFSFLDPSGRTNTGCLRILKLLPTGHTLYDQTCVESVSGTIATFINDTGDFALQGIITLDDGTSSVVNELLVTIGVEEKYRIIGSFGQVISLVGIGTAAMVGVAAGSIVLGLSLIFMAIVGFNWLGWINVSSSVWWGFLSIIILIAVTLRRKGS